MPTNDVNSHSTLVHTIDGSTIHNIAFLSNPCGTVQNS